MRPATMLASIQSAGVAPEVNLRNSWHAGDEAQGSTLALKPRGDVLRSPKQGYQSPHKKDSCPPKIKQKKPLKFIYALQYCKWILIHACFIMSNLSNSSNWIKIPSFWKRFGMVGSYWGFILEYIVPEW